MKHTSNTRQTQRGQAMIEFGIIFILLFVVFVGGAELAATALASNKASEAAEAGVTEYSKVNQRIKTEVYDVQREYLSKLAGLGITTVDDAGVSDNTVDFDYENYLEYLKNTDANGDLVIDENDLTLIFSNLPVFDDYDATGSQSQVNAATDGEVKFKAIIILRQIALLTGDYPLLANHDAATIQRAGCNVVGATTDYDYGLPNRFVDAEKYPEYAVADPEVYLFHPLPIDLASCVGNDPNRGGRSRMSILVSGYFNSAGPEELNVPGLPALNQAMYSLYSKACLNEAGEYMGCENTDPAQILLKAPGKLCLSTVEDEDLDSCTVGVDNVDTAGFYYWNNNIDQVNTEAPQFYPTFQLDCNPNSVTTPVTGEDGIPVFDDDCLGVPQVVRVHVRYRAIFESLIASGVQELNAADTPSYFYNPARVGAAGRINSFPGSEIGYIGANGNPTLKKFKDLRGCYELDVTSNQILSCN